MDSRFEAYARLAVEVGVNAQANEPVVINAPVSAVDFVRLLTRFAYERGASEVFVRWVDEIVERLYMEHASTDALTTVPEWLIDSIRYYYEKGASVISVIANDPDMLKGIPMDRIAAANKARGEKMRPLMHYTMNDELAWTIVALPTPAWAKKVYPEAPNEEQAVETLWNQIMEVTRMNEKDPIAAWEKHIKKLNERAEVLNHYHFRSLHYTSSNGTDLEVELPEKHVWLAATSKNAKGTEFLPNIPTEEVFTAPHREGVNGTLIATKPLAYQGNVINHFRLRFEAGKVVDFDAEEGKDALAALLEQDENAVRLGECALVPYDSPISNSNTLFYETLFDENASCHFAFGACYPTNFAGGAELSREELEKIGGNDSQVHVDFMVGAADLNIVGTTQDGRKVDVFQNGNFVI